MKRNITVLVVILIILTTVVLISNHKERGTFEELVLNKYLNKAQAKEFNTIKIEVFSHNQNDTSRRSKDVDKIDKFLSKFNKLKLIEYNKELPKVDTDHYFISLMNDNTYECIHIFIESDRHIRVITSTLITTENKRNKIIETKYVKTHKIYKIINGDIDYSFLNDLCNSIRVK
ncbi:hypothetical protein [Caloranaerobacter azorensis]|uniref:Uncharacterized protein n=1 Tax=Caloranaerobacter azorensis TaxID=116090 RepID=A0A6P1YED6_9FIRM|nr:hypothetical protein [Caloranaerobacter azorensis]QIB27719.1 hypothetical protein G3A45_10715 [Caloranaerobacter azorensis]